MLDGQSHPAHPDGGAHRSETISETARERRRMLALLVVGSILVVWVVGWLAPFVRVEARLAIDEGRLESSAVCQAVLIGLGFFSCAVAVFGVQAHRFGMAVMSAGRFPPPGTPTTRVVTGRAALILGRVQSLLGSLLVALSLLLFLLVLYGIGRISFS
jgi:hypothetical protein